MTAIMEERINASIKSVSEAIGAHHEGRIAPLSLGVLLQVRSELRQMLVNLHQRAAYSPYYPRHFVDVEINDNDKEFVSELMRLKYDYSRGRA